MCKYTRFKHQAIQLFYRNLYQALKIRSKVVLQYVKVIFQPNVFKKHSYCVWIVLGWNMSGLWVLEKGSWEEKAQRPSLCTGVCGLQVLRSQCVGVSRTVYACLIPEVSS